jgi:hypothetical protein
MGSRAAGAGAGAWKRGSPALQSSSPAHQIISLRVSWQLADWRGHDTGRIRSARCERPGSGRAAGRPRAVAMG